MWATESVCLKHLMCSVPPAYKSPAAQEMCIPYTLHGFYSTSLLMVCSNYKIDNITISEWTHWKHLFFVCRRTHKIMLLELYLFVKNYSWSCFDLILQQKETLKCWSFYLHCKIWLENVRTLRKSLAKFRVSTNFEYIFCKQPPEFGYQALKHTLHSIWQNVILL